MFPMFCSELRLNWGFIEFAACLLRVYRSMVLLWTTKNTLMVFEFLVFSIYIQGRQSSKARRRSKICCVQL